MKYEDYKNLTKEQKEEFNYRFKDDDRRVISLSQYNNAVFFMLMLSIIFIFTCYVMVKSPEMEKYIPNNSEIYKTCITVIYVYVVILFIYGIWDIYNFIKYTLDYNKWKRDNNIVTTKERWMFWKK